MTHYDFDPEFQGHILASFLGDKEFLGHHEELLNPEYFDDELLSGLATTVKEFWTENKDVPSKEALLNEVKKNIAPGRQFTQYSDAIEAIYEKIGVNTGFFQGKVVAFAKHQAYGNVLKQGTLLWQQGEVDEIPKLVSDTAKEVEKYGRNGFYDYFSTIKERFLEYYQMGRGLIISGRIPCGFPPIDERTSGGLAAGETGLIVAPPKFGKTTMLITMAKKSLIGNKRVLYITLELSKRVIASKFDSSLSGDTFDEIKRGTKSSYKKVKEKKDTMTGSLTICEYPAKTLSVTQLGTLISKAAPEIVFVDYASLLRSKSRDARRFELTDIHEGLRTVAGECHVPIWTAHQSNKLGFKSKLIQIDNIAEDFNLAAVHDVLISLNPGNNRESIRVHIMGNRLGEAGATFDCSVNWATSKIDLSFGETEDLEK